MRSLISQDSDIHHILQQHLDESSSLEVRGRVAHVLKVMQPPMRHLRAVQVLERINTPQTRELLQTLATGEEHARQTAEARLALARLGWDR